MHFYFSDGGNPQCPKNGSLFLFPLAGEFDQKMSEPWG